jgi:integrase
MPRPRPPFLTPQRTRHGKLVWYVRRVVDGVRIAVRLRAAYGTPEFDAEYRAAFDGPVAAKKRVESVSGSLTWLWCRYRETAGWAGLSPVTRKARENIMRKVLVAASETPCGKIKRSDILAALDQMAATPNQARHFLDTMRKLFGWAVLAQPDHVKVDPTVGVKNPKQGKTNGFPIWTEDDVERYQARWAVGTKERVWLDVLLYTGLRRGDAVTIGRQHVRNGVATLRTEKSQRTVTVTLPILPVLARTLAAGPCAELAFICGASGKPLVKESFGNLFREACNAAGVFEKSAHGLRKAGATRAADNGATVHELEAIFGWTGGGMAALYTRTADRKRASMRAMTFMEKGTSAEHPIATPDKKVWQSGDK